HGGHRARPSSLRAYAPAHTALQAQLVSLWEELLGIAPVGVDHDFFALGGNSLLAARMLTRAEQMLGIRIPLQILYQHTTISGLARALTEDTSYYAEPFTTVQAGRGLAP